MSAKRPFLKTALFTLVVATLGYIVSGYAADDYYKWVDENGVTHYSARKPHGIESESVSVLTGQSRAQAQSNDQAGSTAAGSGSGNNNGGGEGADQDPAANKDPERCRIAQENLRIMNENARIREKTDDGSFRYLSPEEIAERKKTSQQIANETC